MANSTSVVRLLSKGAIFSVIFIAIIYQLVFKRLIFGALGYGRTIQSIHDFPNLHCEKIDELGLEGCEDMWLHDETGYLYMACSDSRSRRSLTDRIAVLDTRGPGRLASRIKWLSLTNFPDVHGDGTLNLHGFSIRADPYTDILNILLINHRRPLDTVTGVPLDATQVGANSTIEMFTTKAGEDSMRHVRTYTDQLIQTPNRVAWVSEDTFLFTNSHTLDPLLGGGSAVHCHRATCHNGTPHHRLFFPNGLARGRDGLIYIPSTISGSISVFSLTAELLLQHEATIETGIPIDNLSVDAEGDIIAAALPAAHKWLESAKAPFDIRVPSTVLRIKKLGGGKGEGKRKDTGQSGPEVEYTVEKVVEDDGRVLPGSTVAVHDVETGRYFMGGAMAPFIAMCAPREK
ncbi:putative serum paraoxonase/arylesterase [Diplocarpon rosae]|nr:putative serum paraoxonase/arylesterase [Diplocarpon rosae]